MTDHEGIQASKHPKLAEVNITKADQEINTLLEDTGRAIRIAIVAGAILATAVALVVIYAHEIDAWRIAL